MLAKLKDLTAVFAGGLLSETQNLINWDQVKAAAFLVAKKEPAFNWLLASKKLTDLANQAAENIVKLTGADYFSPPNILVLTRQEWVVLTCQTIKPLIEKVQPLLTEPLKLEPGRWLKTGLATELGLALGYLSNHVLGQYSLPFTEQDSAGQLFFVFNNMEEVQKALDLNKELFFYWLASHEYVHYYEFTAFKWLKPYFLELIEQVVTFLKKEVEKSSQGKIGVYNLFWLRDLENNWALKQAQAFMALIEGYSDFLTYQAAAFLGKDRELVVKRLDQARTRPRSWYRWLIEQLLGLELKKQQYGLGYNFFHHLWREGGFSLVNQVWTSPKHLPTLTEIKQPSWWLKRQAEHLV